MVGRESKKQYIGVNVESDYEGSRSFELTGKQREYLLSGETSTYSESELQQGIRSKVERIPERLQSIITDVSLVYAAGYLDTEQNDSLWNDLISIPHRSGFALGQCPERPNISTELAEITRKENQTSYKPPYSGQPMRYETVHESDHAYGLGYEIGGFIHQLQLISSKESAWEDIIWGLIMEYTNSAESMDEAKYERYEQLLEKIDKRMFNIGEPYVDPITPYRVNYERIDDRDWKSAFAQLEEEKDDITMSCPLVSAVYKRAGIPPKDMEVAWKRGIHALQRIIEEKPIAEIELMYEKLENDVDILAEKEWLGIDAVDVLELIWVFESKPSSLQLADGLDKGLAVNLVTTLVEQLATDDTEKCSISEPIVSGSPNGWELTHYGELLCKHHYETDGSIDWLHGEVLKSNRNDDRASAVLLHNLENITDSRCNSTSS